MILPLTHRRMTSRGVRSSILGKSEILGRIRSGWEMPVATATVDRFMHHAHRVETKGESYRLAQAASGKGVTPFR